MPLAGIFANIICDVLKIAETKTASSMDIKAERANKIIFHTSPISLVKGNNDWEGGQFCGFSECRTTDELSGYQFIIGSESF